MNGFVIPVHFLWILFIIWSNARFTLEEKPWTEHKLSHKPRTLSSDRMKKLADLSDIKRLQTVELEPMLIPRVPGSEGNRKVQRHIISRLQKLNWEVEIDTFEEKTPMGLKPFTNVVATLNPDARRRLVLACHFDSKYFANFDFIGATDSAVPCAMLLDLAHTLDKHLKSEPGQKDLTLQLLFFDGEEAFREWTETDSLYGARHLAGLMHSKPHPKDNKEGTNLLHGIDVFVLLDLIGAAKPRFYSYFENTQKLFDRLVKIEKSLAKQELLADHPKSKNLYFDTFRMGTHGGIEDDHVPFMRKNVRILHMIPTPFPRNIWHKKGDNKDSLDFTTIDNLNKILRIFVAEYLHLTIP